MKPEFASETAETRTVESLIALADSLQAEIADVAADAKALATRAADVGAKATRLALATAATSTPPAEV